MTKHRLTFTLPAREGEERFRLNAFAGMGLPGRTITVATHNREGDEIASMPATLRSVIVAADGLSIDFGIEYDDVDEFTPGDEGYAAGHGQPDDESYSEQIADELKLSE